MCIACATSFYQIASFVLVMNPLATFPWMKPAFSVLRLPIHSSVHLSAAADCLFVGCGIPDFLRQLHAVWLQSGCGQLSCCGKSQTHTVPIAVKWFLVFELNAIWNTKVWCQLSPIHTHRHLLQNEKFDPITTLHTEKWHTGPLCSLQTLHFSQIIFCLGGTSA